MNSGEFSLGGKAVWWLAVLAVAASAMACDVKFEKGYPQISKLMPKLPGRKGTDSGASASRGTSYSDTNPGSVSSGNTNDTHFFRLWGLHNEGQTGGTADVDMDAREAWTVRTDCSSVTVGVIDSGIQWDHTDLATNIWTNPGEVAGNGVDDDANGYIDDVHGWDFVNGDNDPDDDNGHGTHVAGIIGAVGNNASGITGVCWTASMAALKAADASGTLVSSDIVSAIDYAVAMGFTVTNNSYGTYVNVAAIDTAVSDANTANHIFVAAAGNDGLDTDATPHYPSSYTYANVVSVAALDKNGALASFTNYGATSVDVGAPGTYIYSTYPTDTYAYLSGTSMATPYVAGAAALFWAEHSAETMAQIVARLTSAGDSYSALSGKSVYGKMPNLKTGVDP